MINYRVVRGKDEWVVETLDDAAPIGKMTFRTYKEARDVVDFLTATHTTNGSA
jgi:hypothetical protein